jgi:hypothetical protein
MVVFIYLGALLTGATTVALLLQFLTMNKKRHHSAFGDVEKTQDRMINQLYRYWGINVSLLLAWKFVSLALLIFLVKGQML